MATKRLLPRLLIPQICKSPYFPLSSLSQSPSRHPRPHSPRRTPPPLLHPRSYSSPAQPSPPKSYTFEDIKSLSIHPSPSRLLIDVREPSELQSTGRIPNSVSMPITSNPDAVYLSPEDFYDRFGFVKPGSESSPSSGSASSVPSEESGEEDVSESNPKPYTAGHAGADVGAAQGLAGEEEEGDGEKGVKEVVFYCKAGVRSRAAMQMAQGEGGWKGVRVGQWGGGWVEWEKKGGPVERS